jgi:hypothetical protein
MMYVEPVTLRQMHLAYVDAHARLWPPAPPRAPVPAKPAPSTSAQERVLVKPVGPAPSKPLSDDQYAAMLELWLEQRRIPQIKDIKRAVARQYHVTLIDIDSSRRFHMVVLPRQVAMYLAKTMTPRSLPEIGRRFGGKDHTTVIHAVRKIDALVKTDQKLADTIAAIRGELGEERRPPSEG